MHVAPALSELHASGCAAATPSRWNNCLAHQQPPTAADMQLTSCALTGLSCSALRHRVTIYESYSPGFVQKVQLIDTSDMLRDIVYRGLYYGGEGSGFRRQMYSHPTRLQGTTPLAASSQPLFAFSPTVHWVHQLPMASRLHPAPLPCLWMVGYIHLLPLHSHDTTSQRPSLLHVCMQCMTLSHTPVRKAVRAD